MDADALNAFMAEAFPQSEPGSRGHVVSAVPGHIQARLDPTDKALRPGGLISGPTQMGFADMAAYALVLAHIGPVAMAVTSGIFAFWVRASASVTGASSIGGASGTTSAGGATGCGRAM